MKKCSAEETAKQSHVTPKAITSQLTNSRPVPGFIPLPEEHPIHWRAFQNNQPLWGLWFLHLDPRFSDFDYRTYWKVSVGRFFPCSSLNCIKCLTPAQNPKAGIHDLLSRKKSKKQTTCIWHDELLCVQSPYFHFGSPSHKCLVMLSNNNIIWKLCLAEWARS